MAVETLGEGRSSDRKRMLKGGKIAYAARCASLPCVVRDMSESGARLQVKDHASVPETFELLIELDGFEVDVEVVWRKQGEVGVIFLTEPVITNPKRHQIVSSSAPKARGTLRRQKTVTTRRDNQDMPTQEHAVATSGLDQPDLHDADQQVEALSASLETLEIVSGELAPRTEAPSSPTEPETSAETDGIPDSAEEPDAEAAEELEAHDDATPDENAIADNEQMTEQQDETFMDQSVPRPELDEIIAPVSEEVVTAGEVTLQAEPVLQQPSLHVEVPMFRDQVAAVAETAPVQIEHASISSSAKSLEARIASALQATERPAAEPVESDVSLVPTIDAEPEDTAFWTGTAVEQYASELHADTMAQDDQQQSDQFTAPMEPVASVMEAQAVSSSHEPLPVSDIEETVAAAVDAPVTTHTEPATQSTEENVADEVALRPDLAAFVQMFAAPAPEVATEAQVTTEPSFEEAPGEAAATDVIESNVVEFAPVSESVVEQAIEEAPVSQEPRIEIIDESIVCTVAPVVPNFCEMQVGHPVESIVQPAAETQPVAVQYEELLPCADAEEFIAQVSVAETAPDLVVDAAEQVDMPTPEVHTPSMEPLPALAAVASVVAVEHVDLAIDTPEPSCSVMQETPRPAPAPVQNIPILIAEDDADDRMFMREAFGDSEYDHDIAFVENGEELLAYLNGEGEYADCPRPGLILLDLNMPKMDGRTALLHIKANPSLRRIPVIVLTTSNSDDDIEKTYDLGVSSYISKPSSADGLKDIISTLNGYWSSLVALPSRH